MIATQRTHLDTEEGALTSGACAKVRFSVGSVNTAVEIDSEPLAGELIS